MIPAQAESRSASRFEIPGDSPGRNPYLFVVGCPRSGTTLLQRLLDHHPMLAVANDTHFVPRCLDKFAPRSLSAASEGREIPLTDELTAGVLGYRRFHRLGVDERDARSAARDASTYREYVGALYDLFAVKHGKPLGGEKTPDYVRRIPLLAAVFPWTRFVHLIRDGRDVALSVLEWAGPKKGPGKLPLWETDPLATVALWWRWQVESGRRAGSDVGAARYLEVRYETLAARPEEAMRQVVDFLDLPFRHEMLAFHEGRTKSDAKLSAKSRWLPPTPGLRDWREQMSAREVAMFEALAGDTLDDLGFERGCSSVPSDIGERAAEYRSCWSEYLERREAKARRRMEQRS